MYVFNPHRGKMAHSHEMFGGCSRSFCPFTCLKVDHVTAQIEVVGKSCYVYLHNILYVSGPVFVKTTNDFNLNIYRLAVYLRLY